MEMKSEKLHIWAVSDGRAGNVAMAMGLAERVAGLIGGDVIQRDLQVNGGYAWLAARLPFLPSRLQMATFRQPDIVVGAGRRVAPAVAGMRQTGAKVVQILDPQMSLRRFDLVVAPEHDGLSAPNVISTLGSVGRITSALLAEARTVWMPRFAHLPRPLMAVLIGGDTKRKKTSQADWQQMAAKLAVLSPDVGMIITTSRRTGESGAACLRANLPEAMIWDGEGENPYFGMLACADAILVTDDSVNMASEAAATGKPLAIYPLLQEPGKTARFHDALIAAGHAERFHSLPEMHAPPLDETGRAAQAVRALL